MRSLGERMAQAQERQSAAIDELAKEMAGGFANLTAEMAQMRPPRAAERGGGNREMDA